MDYSDFLQRQLESWPLLKNNYDQLRYVRDRGLYYSNFTLFLQFNPERRRSTNAKVDQASIEQRPCFLWAANRPPEQEAIDFPPHYEILLNPYPIFKNHLTIADKRHTPQLFAGRMNDFLALAKAMPLFTILYNGAHAGASAPDHFHFQAIPWQKVQLEVDYETFTGKRLIKSDEHGSIRIMLEYLRTCCIIESQEPQFIEDNFGLLQDCLQRLHPSPDEPNMNLLVWRRDTRWTLFVFPRTKHRPCQYFTNEVMISPGAIDMAGEIITVREEDYIKTDKNVMRDIFSQVSLTHDDEKQIINIWSNQKLT